MNTLLLAPELFTTDSGIPRMLRLYLKALCETAGEHEQIRFVALNDAEIPSEQLAAYTTSSLVEWCACRRSKGQFVRSTLKLSRTADQIICGHVAQLPVAWLASLLRPSLKIVLVAHGIEVWRPFNFIERLALRKAHRILCVSDFTRREIHQRIALPKERLLVVPNALDPFLQSSITHPATETSRPVILTVSRLSFEDRYKGIDHLISALPTVLQNKPNAILRIIGRGDDLPRLQALVEKLNLSHAVEFAGFVSDEQLPLEFARAACFALPSQKEGFGLVYLEAMTAGKPCLAARAGGAPEVVTEESGLLVPYGDIDAIAEACQKLLTTKWDTQKIQACADQFSFPRFKSRLTTALTHT